MRTKHKVKSKLKKDLTELMAVTGGGCLGASIIIVGIVLIVGLAFAIGFSISAALIGLLFNVLLPVVGVTYPLTFVQCYVAAVIVSIAGLFIKTIFGRSS